MSLRTKSDGLRQIWQFDNRYQLFLDRIFFPSQNLVTYKYKGLEFVTDIAGGDANGAREVLATEMYRQFMPKMDLAAKINVLDLGANNGGFPLLLLSEDLQFNKLACVELNPRTFSRMRFNVERNADCEFIPINAAVCGQNKVLNVTLGMGGTADSIYGANNSNGNQCQIEGRTFDSIYEDIFADEPVDLCKIDIEGAEFEVFRSETCEKIKQCRYLLMEIHHEKDRNQDRSEIIEILKGFNFREIDGQEKVDDHHHVHLFSNTRMSQ